MPIPSTSPKIITPHVLNTVKRERGNVDSQLLRPTSMSLAFHICTNGLIRTILNNPCIAAAIGSNQDLSFLATRAKALSGFHWSTYYITNYATKDEASHLSDGHDGGNDVGAGYHRQASNPSDAERIALEKGMRNFALRVFNRMSHDKEASSLPQLPTYYTHSRNYIALSSTPASSFCSALR
jgi:hypothetical protein